MLKFLKTIKSAAVPTPAPGSAHMRTESQAANWLGVSIFTLRRRRKEGKIGCYAIGGKYYYSVEQLEAYMKSNELCPKSDSKSETITSSSTQIHPYIKPGTTTLKLDKHAAHHYALKILSKQK